mgnify:FL=1
MKKEKKTSIEQAIDDLLSSGIPENIPLGKLKEYLKKYKKDLIKAEDKFKNHLYPQYKLNWNKNYINNFEVMKIIDTYSISIFTTISKLINKNNLIQLSLVNIINLTSYSKNKIIKSIDELIKKGFITIKLKGEPKTARATIYMINPELVTIGTGNQEKLKKEFWQITGSKYKLNILNEPSKIHIDWLNIIENKNYIIGYDKIQINDKIIHFNKLSKKEKSSKTLESIDEITFKNNKKPN